MQNMKIVLSHTCAVLIIPTVRTFKYSSYCQSVYIECLFKIEITKNCFSSFLTVIRLFCVYAPDPTFQKGRIRTWVFSFVCGLDPDRVNLRQDPPLNFKMTWFCADFSFVVSLFFAHSSD